MSSFVQLFGFDEDGEPPEEHVQPAWLGPPEDELGVATPLTVVLGRSERGAVALVMATSYTTGLTLSFVAQARDLDRRAAHALFHEQHPYGSGEEDLPDGFLRLVSSCLGARRPQISVAGAPSETTIGKGRSSSTAVAAAEAVATTV
jgi:hypothetical protein